MLSKQKRRKGKSSFLFLTLSTLIVLSAGLLTVLLQQGEQSRADASSIVGPPTLPAATVNQILANTASPMMGLGTIVEQAARSNNIDDAFALAVWWAETNDGAAGVGFADRNPGSVRGSAGYPAAYDGYTIYPSYAAAINDWFLLLRNRYVNQGLTSVYAISTPYVGTSGAPIWANKVINLMLHYQGEAPAPIAGASTPITIATPILKSSASPPIQSKKQAHGNGAVSPTKQVQHRRVTVGSGQIQNIIQGSGRAIKVTPGASSRPAHADQIFTTHVQQLLILLVLLAIILAMLPSIQFKAFKTFRAGRKSEGLEAILADEGERRTTGLLTTGSLMPLYVNEYSPLERQQQSMIRETGRLERDVLETGQMQVPATPFLSGPGTVPLTPFVTGSSIRRSEATLKRARLVPVAEISTEVINVKQFSHLDIKQTIRSRN